MADSNPHFLEALRDRPRRLQRLAVLIVVFGAAAMLLYPLLGRVLQDPPHPEAVEEGLPPVDRALLPVTTPVPRGPLWRERAELGKRLFSDPMLSPKGMACSHCHALDGYATLDRPRSPDRLGQETARNIPSLLNVALNSRFGWAGDLRTLAEQLDRVLRNPRHMASSWEFALAAIAAKPEHAAAFGQLYDGRIEQSTFTDAIVSFEEALATPGAPLDRYLAGETGALEPDAIQGFRKFREYGCIACHQGRNLGGNMTARFGVLGNPFEDGFAEDPGLYAKTGREGDRHVFRVPGLRNVALTRPYFHDGSVSELAEAVRKMGRYQLGQELPRKDVAQIVAFLEALTAPPPEILR